MVQISKKQLDTIIDALDQRNKDVELLFKVADKNKLSKVREQEQGANLIRTCRAWIWKNDKVIIVTKLVSNVAEIVNGRYVEDQQVEMVFEDGTNEKTSYLDFSRHKKFVTVEILSSKKEGDKLVYKVQFSDGKTLAIGESFIN